jgi:hypothetical protein
MTHARVFATILTAATAAVAASAIAASGQPSPNNNTTLVLHGTQIPSTFHLVDQPPQGESPGDTISFSENLYAGHRRVGFSEVTGTLLDNKRKDADNITGSLVLRRGTLALQATSLGQAATQHVAIVGGTGTYAGARGQGTITSGRTGDTLRLTFRQ